MHDVEITDDRDRIGHGTAAASVILRIAREVGIVPVRVFGERLETSVRVPAAGLEVAGRTGAELVNVSLGTMLAHAEEPLAERCRALAEAGSFVVAAEHNGGLASFPAAFDTVVGVRWARGPSAYDLVHRPGEAVERGARVVADTDAEGRSRGASCLTCPTGCDETHCREGCGDTLDWTTGDERC